MSHSINKLYTNKHSDCLSSPDIKNALDNIHKDFAVECFKWLSVRLWTKWFWVGVQLQSLNIALVCKRFYATVIIRELGLNSNSSTDTYNNASSLSANDIIDKNIRDLKIKSDIINIPIEKHWLPNMHWMAMMHKNPIKTKFIIVSPKSSIKPLARAITSIFRLFFRQIQTYNNKSRFFYGARCVKNIRDNVLCLNKQHIKDAVAYLLFIIVISLPVQRFSVRLLIFLWGLI